MPGTWAVAVLFAYGFAARIVRLLHDLYAVAIVFLLEEKRVIVVGVVVGGFMAVVLVQHLAEWRMGIGQQPE